MPAFTYLTARAAAIAASPIRPRRSASRTRRRLLDQLLVAPLDRALALAEVEEVAARVAEDLELDVPRLVEVLLEVDLGVAERLLGLVARRLVGGGELPLVAGDAHAAAAAAGRRLQDDGIADLSREREGLVHRVERTGRARKGRDARGRHRPAGERLVAHLPDRLGRRPDEGDVAVLEDLGEVCVLGEEAVARVDRVGLGDLRRRNDRRDVQIRRRRGVRADAHVLVGIPDVEGVAVGLAVDRDGPDAELAAGGDDPQRDLAAVRDEYLLEHCRAARPRGGSRRASRRTRPAGRCAGRRRRPRRRRRTRSRSSASSTR